MSKDYKKTNDLKEEISKYSKNKNSQDKEILDNINYRLKLTSTIKYIMIINIAIYIISIITMMIITKSNILKLNKTIFMGYLNVVDLTFLIILLNLGLSFIVTSFRKITKNYKKKSLKIGIEIIIFTLFLGLFFTGVLL